MARKKKNKGAEKAPVSMDEEIGKGLTPKEKSESKSSAFEKDYEKHPKFSKFKGEG
jgi:hypothetical protein